MIGLVLGCGAFVSFEFACLYRKPALPTGLYPLGEIGACMGVVMVNLQCPNCRVALLAMGTLVPA